MSPAPGSQSRNPPVGPATGGPPRPAPSVCPPPRAARPAGALLLLVAILVPVPGCRGAQEPGASAAEPERARTLQFWQTVSEATSLRVQGDLTAAAQRYEEALVLDPRHEDSLYYLGHCRQQLGRHDDALRSFARLVEVNPQSARGHLALAAVLASPDPEAPLDLDAAESHLRRAHEINGEETGPMVRLGEILLVKGDVAGARRWLEAALQTNPKSSAAAYLLGYLRWTEGDGAGAEALYRKALAAARTDAPIKGVLSEGDRKPVADATGKRAAPPVEEPMGRTMFSDLYAPLREAALAATGPATGSAGSPSAGELDPRYAPVPPLLASLRKRMERAGSGA